MSLLQHKDKKKSIKRQRRRRKMNHPSSSIIRMSVVSFLLLFLSSCIFFLAQQQQQEQQQGVILVEAFAPIYTTTTAATTSSALKQPQQLFLHYRTRPFGYHSSASTTTLSFQRPLQHHSHVGYFKWGLTPTPTTSTSTTQLASSTSGGGGGGGGGGRRGRPPKKSNGNDIAGGVPVAGSGGAPSAEDDNNDVWVDDVDIDIMADLEQEEQVVVIGGMDTSAKTKSKNANGDDEDEDDYDYEYDDDALDELNIDDDDEEDDDVDELEIQEETIGELDDDDDDDDENDVDDDYEEEVEVEWDQDDQDDAAAVYELEDDLDDPNYMKQKQIVQEAARQAELQDQEEAFDALDFVMNELTEQDAQIMDEMPFIKDVEEQARGLMLELKDFDGMDINNIQDEMDKVSDLMDDDPYPRHDPDEINFLEMDAGLTDDDMEELDNTYKRIRSKVQEEPWDKVMFKDSMTDAWENLSQETFTEMEDCLQEIGGSSYNVTRWLLYDLDYNITNLILSAIQHNPQAPIIFQHWYPQLVTYARYAHVREVLDYDFTLHHVENADISELERYYAGFGYHQIPTKMPAETGVISLEYMDEEEIKMAAFENWMKEVYNPEWDRKDFDDDEMRDEDNVFSEFYVPPQHPDLPTFEDALDDLNDWHDEIGHDDDEHVKENPEIKEYRDMMGEKFVYTVKHDEEFQKEFRGHLVVACTGEDADLEIAETITLRFDQEFGKQVYVETRVEALAREEDNVFEVWLESYEIDLLHSKKRATSNSKGWTGPANCDDKQIDFLVSRVRFLISDNARYSYRMDLDIEAY